MEHMILSFKMNFIEERYVICRFRTLFPEIIQFFFVASLGLHNFENSSDHLSFYLSTNDIWMFVDAESSRRGKMVGTKI